MINRDKSAIFFSKNCTDESKNEVRNCLDIQKEALEEKYLGSPTSVGRAMKETFEYMPARVEGLIGVEWTRS
jgi:hypothetical protein